MKVAADLRPPAERTYGLEHVAVGIDLRASVISLEQDECVEWHWHSETSDIFFCLEGVAVIETRSPDSIVHVKAGDRFDVPPTVAHRVTALNGDRCRLLLLQGVGKVDFHRHGA